MKTCKEMVTEFHKLNGSVIDEPSSGPHVAVLRSRLILEEFAETYSALHEENAIEVADGLTDLLYVIYGTAVSYGVQCSDVFIDPAYPPVKIFWRADVLSFCIAVLPRLQRVITELLSESHAGLESGLIDLVKLICEFSAMWSFPMAELFAEVHRSNMTKTLTGNTASGEKYGSANSKGPGYSPPDIAGVLKLAHK